jgi:hypothetical protein
MFVTSFPRMSGDLRIDHIEKWVTYSSYVIPPFPTCAQKVRHILGVVQSNEYFEHIEIVPHARSGLLAQGRGKVDDAGNGTV